MLPTKKTLKVPLLPQTGGYGFIEPQPHHGSIEEIKDIKVQMTIISGKGFGRVDVIPPND